MRVEPLPHDYLRRLALQPHQVAWRAAVGDLDLTSLTGGGNLGWAGVGDDGEPVAVMGVVDMGGGRGSAWALIGAAAAGRGFVRLHRTVRRRLDALPFRRLEAATAVNFRPAHRWAAMLGFNCEGVMRSYCHDGSDAELWARVRHG